MFDGISGTHDVLKGNQVSVLRQVQIQVMGWCWLYIMSIHIFRQQHPFILEVCGRESVERSGTET